MNKGVIRIPKTAEIVAASIRKSIIRGEIKAGDFLQPEAQLMDRFGTSRPTIREAFRILENDQLISVQRGARTGARVQAPSAANAVRLAGYALQAQGALLSDVYQARLAIEPFGVRLVAETADLARIETLEAELRELDVLLERDGSSEAFRIGVFRLHHSILEAGGMNTLTLISAMIKGVAEQHMSKLAVRDDVADRAVPLERSKGALRSFAKLFQLFRARDADAAEAHWRAHIRNANEAWVRGHDQTAVIDVVD